MAGRDLVLLSGGSRLAGDEPNAEYIPSDVVITSASQGGFKTLDCSLLRSASTTALERMYGSVTLTDEDGDILWNGELRRPDPATFARSIQTQTPQAVGWQAVAEDREDVMFIGLDRAIDRFGAGPLARRAAVAAANKRQSEAANGGALVFSVPGYAWSDATGTPICESIYNAGPLRASRIDGTARSTGHTNILVDPTWVLRGFGSDDPDVTPGAVTGSNMNTGALAGGAAFSYAPGTPKKQLGLQLYYPNYPAGSTDDSWEIALENLVVFGDHGLPVVGSSPANYGLLASDMVRYLIGQFGEGVLTPGYIPATTAPIGHFTQVEHGTLGQAINAINAFHGYTSAVWENGLWDFHEFGQGPRAKTWEIHADDIAELRSAGLDGSMLWSGLIVTYTDPTGERRSVGPPGSVADEYDERLELTDPTHPCVAEGKRRWCRLDIGSPVMKETAVFAGAVCLSERNQARRAGTATIVGPVLDRDADVLRPAHRMRGGDLVVITGRGDDTPHRIIEGSATPAQEVAELTLDDTRAQSDIFLAHLQAQLTGRL